MSVVVSILIFLAVAIVALATVALFLNDGRTLGENGRWVKDSVQVWRESKQDTTPYEVNIEDAHVNDVFTSFEEASGDGYLSLEEVSSTLKPVTEPFSHVKFLKKAKAA